jgi:hypothetical protein
MSTDLYRVRVLSVEGDRITCRVTAFIPQSDEDPPPSRTLALQFLWEPWYYFSIGLVHHMTDGRVSPEQAEELAQAAPIGRELAGKVICDGVWTRSNVGRFIRHVEVHDRRWVCRDCCAGNEEGYDAQALFVIAVTEPRWLEHLRPGMEWETTAYDKDEKD